jgi:transcriptional regulator with XRE-family HTH domain
MTTWIKNKRKDMGLSQLQVAETLGISRPTYVKLETGETEPTAEQRLILQRVLGVNDSLANITNERNVHPERKENKKFSVDEIVEDVAKFKEVLLYLVNKTADKPNIGQTALYKLLYFIDFDFYEKNFRPVMGATYIKNNFGPTPVSFAKIVRELENEGKLLEVKSNYFNYDQTRYMVTKEPQISLLSGVELKHIDDEIDRLANKSARELSDLSHIDTPWRVAKEREVLDYYHAFYRPEETSVAVEDYES